MRAERLVSALTRLEARVALADHEDLAAAANDLAITMTLLG